RVLMMSTNNILSPANGKPIIVPTQDMVLGIYYMTRPREFAKGEGRVFASPDEVRAAYDHGEVDLQAKVVCRIEGVRKDTTVGRVLLSDIVPKKVGFDATTHVLHQKHLRDRLHGEKGTPLLAGRSRSLGYPRAARAGISIALRDMKIPPRKQEFLDYARKEVAEIENQYLEGLITDGERYNKVIDIWAEV